MSLYHFNVGHIKRSAGQSAIAAASYRAGEKLYSEYYGEYSDYTRKGGVVHTEIMLPSHAPPAYRDRATLWNAVEAVEHTKKAQLAYSFDIALQNEFSMEENIALARQFVMEQFVARGMIADLAVHMPDKDGGIENPHFHVMCPIRPLNTDGTWGAKQRREYLFDENDKPALDDAGHQKFNAVPTTDWGRPETLEEWRAAWADLCNRKFEEKNLNVRIDHRSYERQGIEKPPTQHEGPAVNEMEKRGIQTNKRALNNWVRKTWKLITELKDMIAALVEAIADIQAEIRAEKAKFDAENIATLLNTYYDRRNAGAYSSKARVNNLQDQIDTFNYLQSKGISTLDDLKEATSKMGDEVSDMTQSLRADEDRARELTDLIRYAENYRRIKPIYDEMNSIRWKKKREKFRQVHGGDLRLFYLARRELGEHVKGKSIPLADWKEELKTLQTKHKKDYENLKAIREEARKLHTIQKNLESALRPQPELRRSEPER